MKIPKLSHVWFFVLYNSMGVQVDGPTIRKRLKEAGHNTSDPAFYQMMGRLLKAGLIQESKVREDMHRKSMYITTDSGIKAVKEVQSFYAFHPYY